MKSAWLFLILSLSSLSTYAYPEFIGYGYASCLTCHVNGLGNGPLNDYGRALWSAEIASRALYPKNMSDESMGENAGFTGKHDNLPYWFRPHFKYREIQITTGLKGPDEAHMNYKMQSDLGVTLSDQAAKYVAMITLGQVQSNRQPRTEKYIAREYYLRLEPKETWWLYVGLLEKAFGIRNVDHSSFQRTFQGFNPKLNSSNGIGQSHGVIVHKVEEKWEAAGNVFVGNPHEDEGNRQKGFSMTGEYEVGELKRAGLSVMDAKNDSLQKDILAVHYRQSLGHGNAFLFEYGYLEDKPKVGDKVRGSYNLLQTNLNIVRGYNFKATIERYNQEFKASSPDTWRWGVGLLAFPIPRLELRVDFINGRAFYEGPASDDSWTMQGQVHVSL
jgi:hypothetical protein